MGIKFNAGLEIMLYSVFIIN